MSWASLSRWDGDSGVGFRQALLGETCPLQTKINNHRLTWFSPGFLPLQNGHKVMNVACGTAYWSLLFIFFLLRLISTRRFRLMWQVKCCTSSAPTPQGYDDGYSGEYNDESYEAYEDDYCEQSKRWRRTHACNEAAIENLFMITAVVLKGVFRCQTDERLLRVGHQFSKNVQ